MSTEQLLCCCLSRWKLQGALSEELAETLESVDLREASGTAAHRDHHKQQHGDGECDVFVLTL